MSLVFSFVNLCRLQMPLLKQHGQGGMHFKSFRALKKHPPLTLRQPMKAHFNGKGRPNAFFSPRKPFRFGPWPSEVFLFPRFQRMMKPRLFIFIPDEYNTFHDFLLHPLKWVKLMIVLRFENSVSLFFDLKFCHPPFTSVFWGINNLNLHCKS